MPHDIFSSVRLLYAVSAAGSTNPTSLAKLIVDGKYTISYYTHMDYQSFTTICFAQGIDPQIIQACRAAVMADDYVLDGREIYPAASLGYSELSDIQTPEQAIAAIRNSIEMSTCDYDKLGRSLRRLRTQQVIRQPSRGLIRLVLKAYYLMGGRADEPTL